MATGVGARRAIIDAATAGRHPKTVVEQERSWLLFVADFAVRSVRPPASNEIRPESRAAAQERYLRQVAALARLSHGWSGCEPEGDTAAALLASRVRSFVLFQDFPGSGLAEVLGALRIHNRFMTWLAVGPPWPCRTAGDVRELLDDMVRAQSTMAPSKAD